MQLQGFKWTKDGVLESGPTMCSTVHGVPDVRRDIAWYEERHGKFDRFDIQVYPGHPKEDDKPMTYGDIMRLFERVESLKAEIDAKRLTPTPESP